MGSMTDQRPPRYIWRNGRRYLDVATASEEVFRAAWPNPNASILAQRQAWLEGPAEAAEPLIHSHVTDVLPDDHPLAFVSLNCGRCGEMLHAGYNECMQTWVETGEGPFCLHCFVDLTDRVIDEQYGLPPDLP